MHHKRSATHGEQDGPLDQSHRADCAECQGGHSRRVAAAACSIADPGGYALHPADYAIDRSAAYCACGCGRRIGGLGHSATGNLENVHLFTPMGTGIKTMVYQRSPAVNRSLPAQAAPAGADGRARRARWPSSVIGGGTRHKRRS